MDIPTIPTATTSAGTRISRHTAGSGGGEINLLELLYVVVKHKRAILLLTLAGFVSGYVAAVVKGPSYIAEALIAPNESQDRGSTDLSSLGMLGGIVASQMNLGGNTSLDKIGLILDSRKFTAEMIEKNNLLPTVYKNDWPKRYKEQFDSATGAISPMPRGSQMLAIGQFVKNKHLKSAISSNTLSITVQCRDSSYCRSLIDSYVDYLNQYLQSMVQTDAKANIDFLENKLQTVADPLLREKIQGLIATELEKTMLVSRESYSMIDPPFMKKNFKEKRIYPILFGFGFLAFSVSLVLLSHAVMANIRASGDSVACLQRIRLELKRKG